LRRFRRLLLSFGLVILATADLAPRAVFAEGEAAEKQEFCPVFTDRIIGPRSRSVRYRGIKVYFSSDLAARKFMRDPVSYLDKELLPQFTGLNLPERLIPQHYCPVYSKRKISVKDPSVLYEGKRVYLFDQKAVRIWNSAPEKFVDLEILPQLAEEKKAPEDEDGSEGDESPTP